MNADQWERAKQIIDLALQHSPDERHNFAMDACGGDEELLSEVKSLLAADQQAGSFLDSIAVEAVVRSIEQQLGAVSPGEIISGRFRIVRVLGQGGMGRVYEAEDLELGVRVALKTIRPEISADGRALRRFKKELELTRRVTHPNVCRTFDLGRHTFLSEPGTQAPPEFTFLTMELLVGRTLSDLLLEKGKLTAQEALPIVEQIANGLTAAHKLGIVHRDIKPGNVMLVTSDDELRVVVTDFGLARSVPGGDRPAVRHLSTSLTREGRPLGTVAYMAPEQLEGGDVSAVTDIYSFGLVIYEMVSGRRPFNEALPFGGIGQRLKGSPPSPRACAPQIDLRWEAAILRCLQVDPASRFQSAREVVDAIKGGQKPFANLGIKFWKVAVPVVLVALLIGGGRYYRWKKTKPLAERDSIVLSDFTNTTNDSVFDDTLKQGLSVQFAQSPFLDLLSESKVNEILKQMGRPAGERLTPAVTREVCQRTGAKAMLVGSIAELGSQYVIGLKALNCNTGDVLAEAQEQATGKETVLKALDGASVTLRHKLGESLGSVQKYGTPLEEATTPSLDALKAYSMGQKTRSEKGETAAVPFFNRAVELDPNFAMAYANLSWCYSTLNEPERAAENASKAYALRDKVSERERYYIVANYYQTATGELEKAAQTYESWRQLYPNDYMAYTGLGFISGLLGNLERAVEADQEAMRLGTNNWLSYADLGSDYANLNRLDEAEAVYKQAEERKLEDQFLLGNRYQVAFLRNDTASMARLAAIAVGKPGMEDVLLSYQADTEAWYGKLKNARELTRRAVDSALNNNAKETAAAYPAAAALREVESGNRRQALVQVNRAVKMAPNRLVRAMTALAMARAGNTSAAQRVATELDTEFPLDTIVQRYWLPSIRAAIAMEHKDPNRAVRLLQTASPVELSAPALVSVALCPAYLRGQAYLMLQNGQAAAGEFQKLIDHRGLVANFPWGALARLGLARAYALQGIDDPILRDKASAAYEDFLALWGDADPDVPILMQAKAEYAKLH